MRTFLVAAFLLAASLAWAPVASADHCENYPLNQRPYCIGQELGAQIGPIVQDVRALADFVLARVLCLPNTAPVSWLSCLL